MLQAAAMTGQRLVLNKTHTKRPAPLFQHVSKPYIYLAVHSLRTGKTNGSSVDQMFLSELFELNSRGYSMQPA
jgi:hypothetical protein